MSRARQRTTQQGRRWRWVRWCALLLMLCGAGLIAFGLLPDARSGVRRASDGAIAEGLTRITQGVVQALGEIQSPDTRAQRGLSRFDASTSTWVDLDPQLADHRDHAVLLVHGLDEPGGIWDQLAPALTGDGHTVIRFDYANDQAIARSADELGFALRRLHALGFAELDLVCHSMGGLVARDALTREPSAGQIPSVGTLITLGTPHGGSPWARLRSVAEAREQVQRWAQSNDMDPQRLLGFLDDGEGRAGIDLLPGSAFLRELDARALPAGLRVICVVGRTDEPSNGAAALGSAVARSTLVQILGERDAGVVLGEVDRLGRELGDGVVPVSSAVLEGADEVIEVRANHRAMIRTIELEEAVRQRNGLPAASEPPAIEIVVERLHRE